MKLPKLLTALASSLLIFYSITFAQTVATDPVGYVTVTISPGNGSQKSTNVVSLPLHPIQENIDGISIGVFSNVTSSSVEVSNAGWTEGALSNPSTPYLLRVTSGSAEGLIIPISTSIPNTSTELYLETDFNGENIDLVSLGIAVGENGDRFEIVPCDTLKSLFGTPESTGIVGGTSALNADSIIIFSSFWSIYFYNTNENAWVKSTFGFPNADNQILHPDFALIYERIGTDPLPLTILGNVPLEQRNVVVGNSGITFLGNGWPVNTTLGESGIEQLPGWVSGSNASIADSVIIRSDLGAWESFFYNGSEWRKNAFGFPNADSQLLKSGSGLMLDRLGSTSGSSLLVQQVPYMN